MNHERAAFLAAVSFLTRIPAGLPGTAEDAASALARSTAYFPIVGILLGGAAALGALVALPLLGLFTASCIAVAVLAVLTGGLHEDAFADVCDAFGGSTPARRREIMKDSRVGSFGVTGLVLLLLVKVSLIAGIPSGSLLPALAGACALSRASSLVMLHAGPWLPGGASAARAFAGAIPPGRAVIPILTALCAAGLCGPTAGPAALLGAIAIPIACAAFFRRWAGGLTGDCVGAALQLVELFCLAAVRIAAAR